MRKSKKLLALFTAAIMAVTVFAGAVPANAASKDFACDGAVATAYVASTTPKTGSAWTTSKDGKSFSYLYAGVFGTRVDKNGDNPRYTSGPGSTGSGTNSGMDLLQAIVDGSGDYYARVVSANIATYNGTTNSTSLTIRR